MERKMIKKIIILFSFLAIANQISAQQNQISFINNTGLKNNIRVSFSTQFAGVSDLPSAMITSTTAKQTLNIPEGAIRFSLRTEGQVDYVCQPNKPTLVIFNHTNLIAGKTYRLSIGNCSCQQSGRNRVCRLEVIVN